MPPICWQALIPQGGPGLDWHCADGPIPSRSNLRIARIPEIALYLPDGPHAEVAFATLIVAALAVGIGTLAGARSPMVALVAGWGVADIVLLLGGTWLAVPLSLMLAALAAVGGIGLIAVARGAFAPEASGPALRVLALAVPLLVIAAAITPAGFDGYSHWLPNLGYFVLHDHLPTLAVPNTVSVRPGYPPGSAFVGLAVSRLVGRMAESAAIVWNVLLLLAVGASTAELIERQRRRAGVAPARWGIAALALLAATFLSPAFDPRLILSNYGDAPAGAVAAIMALALLRWLDDAPEARNWRDISAAGLCGAALVGIRQDSLILFVIVCAAFALALLPQWRRDRRPSPAWVLSLLPAPIVATSLWRAWQAEQIPRGAVPILPLAQWKFAELVPILLRIGAAMLRHWAHFGLIAMLLAVGLWALMRPARFSRLQGAAALMGGLIGLGKTLSLVVVFLGAGASDTSQFWRFSFHAAPVVTATVLLLLPFGLAPSSARLLWTWLWRTGAGLALVLPLLSVGLLRVDHPHYTLAPALRLRGIAREIATLAGGASPITLVDPGDTDYFNIPFVVYVRYELLVGLRPTETTPVPAVRLVEGDPPRAVVIDGATPTFDGHDAASAAAALHEAMAAPFVWFCEGGAAASRLAGLDLPTGASYLVANGPAGARLLRSWADIQAR